MTHTMPSSLEPAFVMPSPMYRRQSKDSFSCLAAPPSRSTSAGSSPVEELFEFSPKGRTSLCSIGSNHSSPMRHQATLTGLPEHECPAPLNLAMALTPEKTLPKRKQRLSLDECIEEPKPFSTLNSFKAPPGLSLAEVDGVPVPMNRELPMPFSTTASTSGTSGTPGSLGSPLIPAAALSNAVTQRALATAIASCNAARSPTFEELLTALTRSPLTPTATPNASPQASPQVADLTLSPLSPSTQVLRLADALDELEPSSPVSEASSLGNEIARSSRLNSQQVLGSSVMKSPSFRTAASPETSTSSPQTPGPRLPLVALNFVSSQAEFRLPSPASPTRTPMGGFTVTSSHFPCSKPEVSSPSQSPVRAYPSKSTLDLNAALGMSNDTGGCHSAGTCKPCAFFHRKGCGNGSRCSFCHVCGPGEKKRRQKERLAAQRTN
eukprot:CAMPEP_0169116688 /NCGR_PEP_ID=MMETSP1015-20121227/30032_1 /TAXON_ID=342587 /ORGANISM="Karlodinium micrum, Strain CCMP2283" /LENGTH=436 /DNA_ID=CAMNT_0009179269 /DNA_START=68 /DNA_END=1378 /DNA_ORIENTATION=-